MSGAILNDVPYRLRARARTLIAEVIGEYRTNKLTALRAERDVIRRQMDAMTARLMTLREEINDACTHVELRVDTNSYTDTLGSNWRAVHHLVCVDCDKRWKLGET